ncbi:hypothetical protein [Tenacibaculum finnmarkense]|uniref:hypothetical protein n=1 Tax=Tenacibaculum finnmarkense TaxID=2781243 RepID=UPI00187B1A5A|nr:hypothetical protein [Tenacibaculum finnmarkense]MBE7646808.1 hypothetical protein [Tenacibaculum finnmarkense genomovar ulcerans]MCD8422015.1 hypothetical protein [Tenacibaculum finnmarkense genomovar ulcerans]MCG8238141.1 hypothetical protein [Tenacibaculum finnmarkense genomovar ulcerans]MCG8795083.1 hypothetical protein [Tenacibaculum finnmarkense]MCG8797410.1 hypothetical protein [Tenacibaculum finnmarkense]
MNFDDLVDIDNEFDVLDELEDLFENISIDEPTKEQIDEMYAVFLDDIVRNPIIIKGLALKSNRNKSRHPVCKGKSQGFEHIITRESKHSGRRNFDKERANKIHWIKPVIENVADVRIKYFEKINDKRKNQLFYWFDEKNFIVIIREVNPDLMLITAYSVDNGNRNQFKRDYEAYKKF